MNAPPTSVLPSAAVARLLKEVPDTPLWVEVRDVLLSGDYTLLQALDGSVVVGTRSPLVGFRRPGEVPRS